MAYTCQNQFLRIPIQPARPTLLIWIWAAIALVFTLPLTARAQAENDDRATGIAAFETTLYPAIREEYCAGCHIQLLPPLIGNDDVVQAYDAVSDLVNLSAPEASLLVLKIAGGHNCTPTSTCATVADKMQTEIAEWADILTNANDVTIDTALISEPINGDASATEAEVTPVVVEESFQPSIIDTNTTVVNADPLPENNTTTSEYLEQLIAILQILIEQITQVFNAFYALINSQFAISPTVVADPEIPDPEVVVEGEPEPEVLPPVDSEEPPETPQEPVEEMTPEMIAEAADMQAFEGTVYPLLRNYCAGCHSDAVLPYMAHSDLSTAYHAVVDNQKVNLNEPYSSRLVQKLLTEFHNCWNGADGCSDDSETMRVAIAAWATEVGADANVTGVEDTIVTNTATLADAGLDIANLRYDTNIIARYEFTAGSGTTASDTSGVETPMNLELSGADWIEGGGIKITSGKATSTPDASHKLYDMIAGSQGSNEYSVEAWIVPENLDQEGPSRIITYSSGTSHRNFTMAQEETQYVLRNRSMAEGISSNGIPNLITAAEDADVKTELQHVIMTFDQVNGRRIYVNGVFTGDVDTEGPGSLANWNSGYTFLMGNETTDNRLWKGEIRFAAIFNQSLTPEQITQNFNAGLGQTYLLRFDTSTWVNIPGSYIEMEVSEFDGFSYLFAKPTFFGTEPFDIPVKNIRIAVNGQIPVTAQAFINVDTVITSNGQQLSPQGSVIAKQLGVEQDGFSLVFEALGDFQMDLDVDNVALASVQFVDEKLPELGLRNFDQINNSMAVLTGVDPNTSNILATFEELKQQLPTNYDLRNIASAHQVAHFKMALEYAETMIGSDQLRDAFFGFSFDPNTAFSVNQSQTNAIVNRIVEKIFNINLADQPNFAEAEGIVKGLVAQLPDDKTALAAAMATVLSSAAALII